MRIDTKPSSFAPTVMRLNLGCPWKRDRGGNTAKGITY